MLWLSTLEGEARLTMLLAMKYAFPRLANDRERSELIDRARDQVKLSKDEHEAIVLRAGRVAAGIKGELEAA